MPLSRHAVFITNAFPEHTYVSRIFFDQRTKLARNPEDEIRDALKQRLAIQVIGPSKSGKTIALERVIPQGKIITIPGSSIGSADSLWKLVISRLQIPLNKTVAQKTKTANGRELNASVKAKILGAEFGGGGKGTHGEENEFGHTVTFSDDLYSKATDGLITADRVLLIDDFHTINKDLKNEIASQIKAALGKGVKICLAEVPHRADEAVCANPDLTGRVTKIDFEYWSRTDLKQIGKVGFEKLKVNLADSSLDILAGEAGGSPQLMQHFCLEAAKVLGIEHELENVSAFTLTPNEANVTFINVFRQQTEREMILNALDKGPDERGKPRSKYPAKVLGEVDNYEIILAAIALNPHRNKFTWDQDVDSLSARINKICKSTKTPQREKISLALTQMVNLTKKYSPKAPILDWDKDKGLNILDPYFLFYLRWCQKYSQVREAI